MARHPGPGDGGKGRSAARAQLSERFQEAIDAAAMRAGLIGTDAYLEEWRRESRGRAATTSRPRSPPRPAQLEQAYTDERLERLVRASGEEEHA